MVKTTNGTFVLVAVTLFSGALLTSSYSSATDTVVDDIDITVPTACSMTGTGMNSHTATINPGMSNSAIGETTLKAYCNDSNGFAIYAIGYSNQEYGNNKLLYTVNGAPDSIANSDINTGLNTTGNPSSWAMKLIADSTETYPISIQSDTEGTFANFHTVPNAYKLVAKRTTGTDLGPSALGSTLKTTYQAYITNTQKAGTYMGKVKYTLVHPNDADAPLQPQVTESSYIGYYANASNVVGAMGRLAISSSDTSAQLIASNFSREGYGFAGWSDAFDYATNPNASFYGPNETITFTAGQYTGDNPGLSLYAVWVPSAGNLQDSSKVSQLCNTSNGSLTAAVYNDENDADESTWSITAGLSSVSALTDTRDNQTYAIARLSDGNCWMIENLRLADTHQEGGNTVPTTLTILNTNYPLVDDSTGNVALKHNYTDTTTHDTLSPSSSVAFNADTAPGGWCSSNSASCVDQSRIRTDNITNRASYSATSNMTASDNIYSYGNYYNWYAATAGNGTYNATGYAAGDLCPAGWHLPVGGSCGEFGTLSNSLGGRQGDDNCAALSMTSSTSPTHIIMEKRISAFPNNYVYAGLVNYNSNYSGRGTGGEYWTNRATPSLPSANTLAFSSSTFQPGGYVNGYKTRGRPIRCIAAEGSDI